MADDTKLDPYAVEIGQLMAQLCSERNISIEGPQLEDLMHGVFSLLAAGLTRSRVAQVLDLMVESWAETGLPRIITGSCQQYNQ